ncbi:MAG: dihydropteroate synthase [Betaproteobacteria bacterium]|nr:dihydropteroate synthase [Betaproteobacteria bacterium]
MNPPNHWQCGRYALALDRPLVMGIVNVTPDSFSDGGKHLDRRAAIMGARQMLEDGADILDIGGESTRPGAKPASLSEELDRVLPVIEALSGEGVPLSVDTRKPEVMRAAIAAGAAIINDVNALQAPGALAAVAASQAGVCLMHMQGAPDTMQGDPRYDDVLVEVRDFLVERSDACDAAGIARARIVIDPGFGFGKTLAHNLTLLRDLDRFLETGYPVLAGLSRKSMLGALTGRDARERLAASIAAALLAVEKGAKVLRVHDVKETVDALKVWQAAR